jgi:hypothetical protein
MGPGMMGYYSGVPTPPSHDDAEAIRDECLASMISADLRIDEFVLGGVSAASSP